MVKSQHSMCPLLGTTVVCTKEHNDWLYTPLEEVEGAMQTAPKKVPNFCFQPQLLLLQIFHNKRTVSAALALCHAM